MDKNGFNQIHNCIRVIAVVFEQKLLYSGRRGCIRAKWLYSCKVVEIGQKSLYSGKVFVLGRSGCIRAKWLYLVKVVVFG